MEESKETEDLEFEWGKKRGIGGKKKDVQFYESFTFDREEYSLYDCVYVYKDGEPEPYIGKILKIWEHADKAKRVKLLWFFRPYEVSHYVKGVEGVLENEIFLASGDGPGLANVNPVEAIAGKCNVVCISRDNRNLQPSDDEIRNADFVFHRTFDVGQCKLLDKMDEKVAGIEVKYIFNRPGCQKSSGMQRDEAIMKEIAETNVAKGQQVISSKENTFKEPQNVEIEDDYIGGLVKQNQHSTEAFVSQESGYAGKKGKEIEGPKQLARQNSSLPVAKSTKGSGELDDRPHKKQKLNGSVRVSDVNANKSLQKISIDEDAKSVIPVGGLRDKVAAEKDLSKKPSIDDKNKKILQKSIIAEGKNTTAIRPIDSPRDIAGIEKGLSKKPSFDDKLTKPLAGKVSKPSSQDLMNEDKKTNRQVLQVTCKPGTERRNWFWDCAWEDRMRTAHEQGALVLLQNLDPTYTSAEVEDIVWHGFKEYCTAKMIQCTTTSVPHIGQALVAFKTRETAQKVVRKLDEECLLLSNGRPLVGSIANPCPQGKQSTFFGHLSIDKLRLQMQRDMRNAVSTSHCSQPNTLEYDMALEWCMHQAKFDRTWERMFKQQKDEMRKVQGHLKSKLP